TRSDRDWSSDVCSSDLGAEILTYDPVSRTATRTDVSGFPRSAFPAGAPLPGGSLSTDGIAVAGAVDWASPPDTLVPTRSLAVQQIGRASCRERGETRGG